jgi:o-succinylbenzoate---CoA ligase
VALDLPGGTAFVDALRRVWDRGDAAFPVDQRLPVTRRHEVLDALGASTVIDASGDEHRWAVGRPVEPGDALVVATSGSTGQPRGVVLTHDAVAASARLTTGRLAVDPNTDRWLACLPLSHIGGLSVVTRALHTGTPLTVLPGPDPDELRAAVRAGATLVSLVPILLGRIDAALFRLVLLGGSRPPTPRAANVIATYGMTETGSGIVYEGRPLDEVELRVDDTGELHVRGPMLLRCYRDGEVPLTHDGWFATGDIGSIDAGGTLQVRGRRGDLIITGGENVWPDPVEAVLGTHPRVAEVAVTGRGDPEWGQIVVAWVVPVDTGAPPTLQELRAHCKEHLPAFQAPRALELTDRLPLTTNGKVQRSALGARD